MALNPTAYKQAMQPQTPWLQLETYHLDDETLAAELDTSARHSKAAQKAQERKRQRRAEQQAEMERETQA